MAKGEKASALERRFAELWDRINGPAMVAELRFHPGRRWRFDFANADARVAIELEGGVWSGGRHTRGSGFVADCEKYNAAALYGWTVFRLTRQQINVEYLLPIHDFCWQRIGDLRSDIPTRGNRA
jgi:very-short-patch-repair endonuclease